MPAPLRLRGDEADLLVRHHATVHCRVTRWVKTSAAKRRRRLLHRLGCSSSGIGKSLQSNVFRDSGESARRNVSRDEVLEVRS